MPERSIELDIDASYELIVIYHYHSEYSHSCYDTLYYAIPRHLSWEISAARCRRHHRPDTYARSECTELC